MSGKLFSLPSCPAPPNLSLVVLDEFPWDFAFDGVLPSEELTYEVVVCLPISVWCF